MAFLKQHRAAALATLAALDSLCILAAFLFAASYSYPLHVTFLRASLARLPYLIIFILFWYGAAIDQRLWGSRRSEDLSSYMFAVTKAVTDAMVFSVFVMVIFTSAELDREFLASFCLAILAGMLAFRVGMRLAIWELRGRGFNTRLVLLVGANERATHLVNVIRAHDRYGYRIAGFLEDEAERTEALSRAGLRHLGGFQALAQVLREQQIDEVFVCLPVRSFYETIQSITHYCEGEGVPVGLVADLFPLRIATSRLMHIEDIPLLSLSAIPEARVRLGIKRAVDLVVSTMLLLLLAPFLLALAILIKLDSKGPVFFLQERVGQNQRRFKMTKFRSMVMDAEAKRKELEALNEADGPVFKIRHDPRITRVGRVIRRFSIDELPQLFNVWKGEMSLVGPRPPIPSEVVEYTWDQRRRLSVRPGMTGLWQVSGRSNVAFSQWVEMDLAYIDSWSLLQDFVILFKTFRAVIEGRGAA